MSISFGADDPPLDTAAWLASASPFPRSVRALWAAFPDRPQPLPCGTVFDVVSVPAVFGRRMVGHLASAGGAGPVAVDRGRALFFARPGTARRLPALLRWEEWHGQPVAEAVPAFLGYGPGDVVGVPAPPLPGGSGTRWLVPPDGTIAARPTGARELLWAAVRTVRAGRGHGRDLSISAPADAGAKVYDVSRRR
ncbi:bifunctional DNA primase/polymerase [Streptomyces chumphonensis]|uniref:bifunctional DNA primase/polymerase n=1 Tax=Streptomyces chumphonensis TaxID=1214925 RepID=UPI003D759454